MEHSEQILVGLCGMIVLGTAAQWIAWRLRLPSILLLLAAGLLAGPVTGWLVPDELFGDLLLPIVSASVAVILFEGSLSLRLSEFREMGRTLLLLLTVGSAITWLATALAARWVLSFDWSTALLTGALLVVTGPTVIGPLLRQIRPVGPVGSLARWEGIIIDPLGAVLALMVFEATFATQTAGVGAGLRLALQHLLVTLAVGGVTGLAGAAVLGFLLRRHALADHLEAPVTLGIVLGGFAAANHLQEESGLLAVTVMGAVLGNVPRVSLRHILEFKENLSVLLISSLFVVLSARLDLPQFATLGWRGLLFVIILIVAVRPASVFTATLGSSLKLPERSFLAWLAPRGIVAAAVASVFALRLGESGDQLVPAVFSVIAGTVIVYGFTSFLVARWLGLASADPQGVLIAGAHRVARAIAHALQEQGYRVLLVDSNRENVMTAKLDGLSAVKENILSDGVLERLNLGGLGRFLGMTPNDEVNSLAAMQFRDAFGRNSVYQLPRAHSGNADDESSRIRALRAFGEGATFQQLQSKLSQGAVIKATHITDEFDGDAFREHYGDSAVLLFISTGGKLRVCREGFAEPLRPGQTVIALVEPSESESEA